MSTTETLVLLQAAVIAYAAAAGMGLFAAAREGRTLLHAARAAMMIGSASGLALIVLRGVEARAFPLLGIAEAIVALAVLISLFALFLDRRYGWPAVPVAVAPVAASAVLGAAALGSSGGSPPPSHALGPWTVLHVLAMLAAFGSFAFAFVAAVLFLIERRQLKVRAHPPFLGLLPSLEGLYAAIVRSAAVGLVLLTGGLLVGYLHARNVMSGSAWRVDAKTLLTTATWAAYLLLLMLSAAPSFRGRRTAIVAASCFVFVAATVWAGVFWSGFHRFL